MSSDSMEIVQVSDLYKSYRVGTMDVPVLRGISMTIRRGEIVALIGSSGSGKTTLMNIIGCLDRPTTGRFWFDGEEVSMLSRNQRASIRNKKIGFVFQNFNLLPRTSALENVVMPMLYLSQHVSTRDANERAKEMLERVGLSDRLLHDPSQLSGGQQQRVAIARALVNSPELLLADEPTGNLDTRTGTDILKMFQDLNEKERIAILLITHDPKVVAYANRVISIRDGMIVDNADES